MKKAYLSTLAAAVLFAGLAGCGGSSSDSGVLSVELTDAPAEFQAVYVTVAQVAVHRAGDANASWITIADVNGTFDLLQLQNGTTELLGVASIPVADYTQMRLILADESNDTALHPYGNYVVVDGNASELTVPSMELKESHNFTMAADGNVTMTIDFDANRSIHAAGSKWILNPVLHVTTH